MARIYGAVAHRDGDDGALGHLQAICHVCVEVLPVDGAGVMLMAERAHQGTLYATDPRIQRLEELQNAAAEGPCIDSYNLGRPVLEPDLAGHGVRTWPLLAPAALDLGISALFSFPLQIDDASVGALDLFREQAADLTIEQVHDARLLAAMATREVLTMQTEGPPGTLPDRVADLSGDRAAIEQATGMAAAQMGGTVAEAAVRLREVASGLGRPLAEIAHEVVARTLRIA